MTNVQKRLSGYEGGNVHVKASAEKAGLGPKTSGQKQRGIKAGRLKGQLFACELNITEQTDDCAKSL